MRMEEREEEERKGRNRRRRRKKWKTEVKKEGALGTCGILADLRRILLEEEEQLKGYPDQQ